MAANPCFRHLENPAVTDQAGPPTKTVADVAEQLMNEFGLITTLDTITACVLSAQRDLDQLQLDHTPPTLLDRFARARLLDALDLPNDQSPPESPRAAQPAS
jgi:hypothetical protein